MPSHGDLKRINDMVDGNVFSEILVDQTRTFGAMSNRLQSEGGVVYVCCKNNVTEMHMIQ
ncbi:hypothetical protein MYP_3254 [Sporocytophaga myxococcoides]|uniref:Uncharacterized protein n=1 Tax=Sporocytophaga myxococcoides TaxID=153721 RepID=A0A098LGD3_9BACT|nr:hypothetical protein MYP_3254 [Sporocytophaga myxococcoides]